MSSELWAVSSSSSPEPLTEVVSQISSLSIICRPFLWTLLVPFLYAPVISVQNNHSNNSKAFTSFPFTYYCHPVCRVIYFTEHPRDFWEPFDKSSEVLQYQQ